MKKSEVFRTAAWTIAENKAGYACLALSRHVYDENMDMIDKKPFIRHFEDVFSPEILPVDSEEFGWWGPCNMEDAQIARTLALLFMAEIAEDEGNDYC